MNDVVLELALGVDRLLLYVGYVLLAGILVFWLMVWPNGHRERRLVALVVLGTGLMALATLLGPLIPWALEGQSVADTSRRDGAAALARLGALSAMAFFLTDVVASAITGWRRVFAASVVIVLTGSIVAQSSAVGGRWEVIEIVAMSGHVVAAAAWFGGLIAVFTVLRTPAERNDHATEPDWFIHRFSLVVGASVAVLVVTGTAHALAVAGGPSALFTSTFGLVLLVKVAAFALMLRWGRRAPRDAAVAVGRLQGRPAPVSERTHAMVLVTRTELALGSGVLVATAIVVALAP